jgi:tetratricopeptide (TPR) repeat protein
LILAFIGLVAASVPSALAQPYTPASDDEVLERLPFGLRSAEMRRDRAALADDPENLSDSVSMAHSYLATARTEGDSRFLGYAQSILGPWWNQTSPPIEVRLVRAMVFGMMFEFDRALLDLDAILAAEPGHATAWATRMDVCLARGDVSGARKAFEAVQETLSPPDKALALARCERMTRRLAETVRALESSVAGADSASATDRPATLALLAELLMQQGRPDEAAMRLEQWRRLGKRDVRVLALEADLLLDRGRFVEVLDRLKGETAHDGLAVRLLEAWQRAADLRPEEISSREELRRQVEKRLEDRRARGDASALPDEVLYWVRVQPDAAKAVERAGELWAVRRTLDDARWVLEAARLGKNAALRRRVMDWASTTGIQDARLEAELGRAEARP